MKWIFRSLLIILLFVAPQAHATDRYVSKLGSDANAPCTGQGASACLTVSQCITSASTGDNCFIGAGVYSGGELGSSGYVLQSGKNVSLIGQASSSVTFIPSVATAGIRLNNPVGFSTTTISDIAVTGTSTSPNYCFWLQESTSIYNVVLKNVTCTNPGFYGTYISSASTIAVNAFITNSTTTANNSARSHIYTERSASYWNQGNIVINGGGFISTAHLGNIFPAILVNAGGATNTVSITNTRNSITMSPSTAGDTGGIWVYNVKNALIQGNDVTVSIPNNLSTSGSVLYRVASCGTTTPAGSGGCLSNQTPQDSSGVQILNNTGTTNTFSGGAIMYGNDFMSTSAYYANNGLIQGNTLTCTRTVNTIHGLFHGYSIGSISSQNLVNGCGYGGLTKDTINSKVYGNIIKDAVINYFYAKGSTSTVFANNTSLLTTGTGTPLLLADDTEGNATSSKNIVLKNNIFYNTGATPTNLVQVNTNNTLASVDANDWYGFNTPQWVNGSTYLSVDAWNQDAVVGTDLTVNPFFVNYPFSLRLLPGSPLISAGTKVGDLTDYLGRYYNYKPSIGAYEYSTRDFISPFNAYTQ